MLQFLKNYLWHLPKAIFANLIYRFPGKKLIVIGVTGTKGKTSTTHLIHHLLTNSGHKTLLISTITSPGFHVTSPSPFALQKALRHAVTKKATHAVLEVTSHGLDQFRVWGIPFKLAVFTQIVTEHLDYHQTLKKYRQAKAKLISLSQKAIINQLDPSAEFLLTHARNHGINATTYGIKNSDFVAQNQQAALAATASLGVDPQAAQKALATFPGIKGRMEIVYNHNFKVIIDFAHTPDSLKAALNLLKSTHKKSKTTAVFGCAGERDPGRRQMGAVSAKLADFTIITAEDPRSESVEEISAQIAAHAKKAGAKQNKDYIIIYDRAQAIQYAIAHAQSGDIIAIFGKGHEQSMCFGKIEYPWSDHEAVKKALQKH